MARELSIMVRDCVCPICGAEELGPDGKLQVRGFKVHDHGMWWSECISGKNHGTTLVCFEDGREVEVLFPEKPWFAFQDNDPEPDRFFVQVKVEGKNLILGCYGEEG